MRTLLQQFTELSHFWVDFGNKTGFLLKEVSYKVSFCENFQQQHCMKIIYLFDGL